MGRGETDESIVLAKKKKKSVNCNDREMKSSVRVLSSLTCIPAYSVQGTIPVYAW